MLFARTWTLATAAATAGLLLAAPVLADPTPADDDGGWGFGEPEPAEAPAPSSPSAVPEPPAPPAPPPRVVVAPSVTSAASEETTEAPRRPAPGRDLGILGSIGIMTYPDEGGGFLGGISVLYRSGLLGVGGFAEFGGLLMSMVSGGGMAGVAFRTDGGFRAEVLGTAGIRHYEGWGTELLSDDPGATATLPFVGLSARLGYIFSRRRRGHFNLGGFLAVDRDLWRETKTYQYQSDGWLDDTSSVVSETQIVGGTRFAFGLTLGATIDLGR